MDLNSDELECPGDAPSADPVGFEAYYIFALIFDGAGLRTIDPGNDIEEGRLSGPVGPYQPYDLSLAHIKGDFREDF